MEFEDHLYKETIKALINRGVRFEAIAELVVNSQKKHSPEITEEEALHNIDKVLQKREVQHAVLTGIELDVLAEKGVLSEPLLSILRRDEGLYGVDETVAVSIANCYGSIALMNLGHMDIDKPGIVGEYNDKGGNAVHTFLDDIIASIAAAACSRYAHNAERKKLEKLKLNQK